MFIVAEILSHGQPCVADTEAASGRFIHLPKNHRHVRQHTSLLHVAVEFLALAATLADPAKNAHSLMMSYRIVNHLTEQDSLANAGTAKQSCLAATLQRHKHIDDLDAGLKDLRFRRAPRQRRR